MAIWEAPLMEPKVLLGAISPAMIIFFRKSMILQVGSTSFRLTRNVDHSSSEDLEYMVQIRTSMESSGLLYQVEAAIIS